MFNFFVFYQHWDGLYELANNQSCKYSTHLWCYIEICIHFFLEVSRSSCIYFMVEKYHLFCFVLIKLNFIIGSKINNTYIGDLVFNICVKIYCAIYMAPKRNFSSESVKIGCELETKRCLIFLLLTDRFAFNLWFSTFCVVNNVFFYFEEMFRRSFNFKSV